jgi:DNA repair protein RadC
VSAEDRGGFGRNDDELVANYRRALARVTRASDLVVDRLVDLYRDGRGIRSAPERELIDLGCTAGQARRLRDAFALAAAHHEVLALKIGRTIRRPEDAASAIRAVCQRVGGHEQECFVVLSLSARQHLLDARAVALGSVAQVDVRPSDALRHAIRCGAHSVVVGHCHPSGDPTPSPADVELTRRLVAVGQLVAIPILDHVIVTERGEFASLAALGLVVDNK